MTQKPLLIIGGGGHTGALLGVLLAANARLRGIVTSNEALVGKKLHGVPVLGLEGAVRFVPPEVSLVNGVGNKPSSKGPDLETRADIEQRYTAQNFDFASVISERAIVQPAVTLGASVQIMPGVVVQAGASIGKSAILNTGALIDHDVVIGEYTHVAPGAILCGNVQVGAFTHIGAGAVVIQGVRIGSHVVIGAGITVRRDVSDGELVVA